MDSSDTQNKYGPVCHVYSSSAALCFAATNTRKEHSPTISIDGSLKHDNEIEFDWRNKISLQCTRRELPVLAATLSGYLHRCEFRNHGEEKNKSITVTRQEKNLYVELTQKGKKKISVPVTWADAFYVSTLVLEQLRISSNSQSATDVLAILKTTTANLIKFEKFQ